MKLYTRHGDQGMTSLFGGRRVPKSHVRVEACGAVDELNAQVGLIRDQDIGGHAKEVLRAIQDKLLAIGALLSADARKQEQEMPELGKQDVALLEKEIDEISALLPPLNCFIVPGGHQTVSCCHIARSVCRRAERAVVRLAEKEQVDEIVVPYLNRLSDYLFVLARKTGKDKGTEELLWRSKTR